MRPMRVLRVISGVFDFGFWLPLYFAGLLRMNMEIGIRAKCLTEYLSRDVGLTDGHSGNDCVKST